MFIFKFVSGVYDKNKENYNYTNWQILSILIIIGNGKFYLYVF